MTALKLRLYQDLVSYRKPRSFKNGETYPLPPPSTVNGFFHRILDAKELIPMRYSIQGTYSGITNNLQRLYKFGKVRADRRGQALMEVGNTKIATMVFYTNLLVDVELIIHVDAHPDVLTKLKGALDNPREFPSLGRREDLVRIDSVGFVELTESENNWDGILMSQPAYVPKEFVLQNNLHGINYRLNDTYVLNDGFRQWEPIEMLYVEPDRIFTKIPIDSEGDLVFWHKNHAQ
jgi:CRISPR-associated protein Cas5t